MIRLNGLICATILGCGGLAVGGEFLLFDASPARLSAGSAGQPNRELMTVTDPHLQTLLQSALEDAGRRTRLDVSALSVVLAERVTWPDGALGCPQPGMAYPQALVPGYRIHIIAGNETLHYHAGRQGQPFFCPAARVTPPTTDPRT
jgi:hypothetical protein